MNPNRNDFISMDALEGKSTERAHKMENRKNRKGKLYISLPVYFDCVLLYSCCMIASFSIELLLLPHIQSMYTNTHRRFYNNLAIELHIKTWENVQYHILCIPNIHILRKNFLLPPPPLASSVTPGKFVPFPTKNGWNNSNNNEQR